MVPKMSISDLRELSAAELQKKKLSYELTSKGKTVGFLVIPQNDHIADVCRHQVEMSNITAGD